MMSFKIWGQGFKKKRENVIPKLVGPAVEWQNVMTLERSLPIVKLFKGNNNETK